MNPKAQGRATQESLSATLWDLVVIGGGITGAGVAQQAARQGWKVLLIEQQDFAWGSSSRSSKLVHGGLRYLKEGDFKTTWHSVRERERLMRQAPELIEAQSFLFADCVGRKPGRWMFQLGLMIYEAMSGQGGERRQRGHFYADAALAQTLAPGLNPSGLRGAMVYQDAKTDDARLVYRVLMEAQQDGAVSLNYTAAQSLQLTAGRISGVTLRDTLTGHTCVVNTRAVINATGAWADRLRSDVGGRAMLRPLRGSHLIVPFWRLPVAQSVSLMHPQDGRPVFLYPWEGSTLIGTTDLDHPESLDVEASITPAEVSYLIAAVNDQFPGAGLTQADVTACYAGVRPVVADDKAEASKATRDHVVLDESGLITLAGGKLTTFRLMAQDALALAAQHVGKQFAPDDTAIFSPTPALPTHWSAAVRARLAARYGAWAEVLSRKALAPELEFIPGTQTLWLELPIAAQHEAVVHLDDLLLRRTRLGLLLAGGGLAHLQRIQALCEPHLRWGQTRWDAELARYLSIITAHYQPPPSPPLARPVHRT
ncbi:glycerol-3-phosphate dehydrogenase/oxidase [Roseateles koreensis]|uniref:Glycerol-3-phosphate dehydrogenase/oxidase n=1 Tax=Roseateles koreensis TaxID=2987526 RepID=A0ABT5KQG1_9BURK|nr:glycerol-3-phosphate dehydrogenase/oxidase [Roseateles koreensis]MDC8785162.1 glycerol-3-phosphate dehydrogenase/oxidase [Roseateles koreensis]